jgi:TetR/AcrR family transcriptional regulator, acrAB operon repressor
MVRKTKVQAANTREQLLDAAERVFRQRGVTKTSLAEIAAAAGVTRGAVYWHFKDKADLFEAMCQRATLPLDALLDEAGGKTHADPLDALRILAIAALTRLASDARTQAVFEVIFHKSELTDELSDIGGRQERNRCDCLSSVEAILQQAVTAGQLPPDTDTALATQLLHAFMSGTMREWVLDKGAYDLATHAPALVDTIIAGLAANPPRRGGRIRPRVRPRAGAAA